MRKNLSSTAQKKFFIKDFFSICDQICSFLRIWSHLLKKSLMENFIFCEVQLFSDLLDKDKYDKIWPKDSRPEILYDNPKIHKSVVNNLPKFRPILSAINIPEYNIAKFLIPTLEPLTHNEFTIKDSFNFSKEITTYDSSLCIASLDVESVFTNIPLNKTINNCLYVLIMSRTRFRVNPHSIVA